ncbi:hypothetical protein HU200_064491 [Digitaria exilis]|uniref:DUF6598 domain-containing protein n=1 Tax=Digitaria exilis TaxID=1010633 RepID=A0A835A5F6_9POAL|nr:hypothetical protein HU200_064491 [Digitaria exilis]
MRRSSEGGGEGTPHADGYGDYEYIILPGGDRFDIPEGEDKQEWIQFFDEASRATREVIARRGDGRLADGINRAVILPDSTHRDGSIYSIYGYIAARDTRDPLRNYVFNRSRDNPITLEQGSLIEMIGPKRGIEMHSAVLIEYDLRIKKGELEGNDMQLIDGVSDFDELIRPCKPFLSRIDGVGGAVDITLAMFHDAVEATIEVDISEVRGNGFTLQLNSSVGGLEKEIQLFHGTVSQSCGLRRFVVAVVRDTWMHLNFKFGIIDDEVERRCASFKAKMHGYASEQIKVDEASVMVKVTWSTW